MLVLDFSSRAIRLLKSFNDGHHQRRSAVWSHRHFHLSACFTSPAVQTAAQLQYLAAFKLFICLVQSQALATIQLFFFICSIWLAVQSTRGVVSFIDNFAVNHSMHVADLLFLPFRWKQLLSVTIVVLFSSFPAYLESVSPSGTEVLSSQTSIIRYY